MGLLTVQMEIGDSEQEDWIGSPIAIFNRIEALIGPSERLLARINSSCRVSDRVQGYSVIFFTFYIFFTL